MSYELPPGLPGMPLPPADDEPKLKPVGKFKPGPDPRRGNRAGRPNRTPHWFKIEYEKHKVALLGRLFAAAKAGDMTAMRLIIERVHPKPRSAPIEWNGAPTDVDLSKPEDRLRMLAAIGEAVANGQLAPDEGQSLAAMIEAVRRSDELDRIASDIEQIKKAMGLSR